MEKNQISIIFPKDADLAAFKSISGTAWHDLGMDAICDTITSKEEERSVLRRVMMQMSPDPAAADYRIAVFEDILRNPQLRIKVMSLLEQVKNLQDYMSTRRNIDKSDSIWTLTRRLKEVNDYILCIESLADCLSEADLKSQGLLELRAYMKSIQSDCSFFELKADIGKLHKVTNKVRSVTLGVNLDENYDAESVGIVSLNDKQFSQSGLLSAFTKKLGSGDHIQNGTDWNGKMNFEAVSTAPNGSGTSVLEKTITTFTAATNPLQGLFIGMSRIRGNSAEASLMGAIDDVANKMMNASVRELKEVLAKHATVSIYSITNLIPEFLYYILWAGYIEKLREEGYSFNKATVLARVGEAVSMQAKDVYNLKLAVLSKTPAAEIVGNDLDFSDEHCAYILTGANRGGKTTITQTIGQQFILAQGGIYIPGAAFAFVPVDGIFTHFPADEDKTLDFGRLGEECQRFKGIYSDCTGKSLLLLNETFSTTSFEEGYYIAYDAIRAILRKGVRTIYNTHMHKLAREVDTLNAEAVKAQAASLVVQSEGGKRSYKVKIAPATGNSYAQDIAEKYGVTFEQLTLY